MKRSLLSSAATTLLLATTCVPAAAAEADARAAGGAAVARFIDAQTIGLARADLTRVDAKAVEAWLVDVLKGAAAEREGADFVRQLGQARAAADKWLADFRKAGGREVYVVLSLADLPAGSPVLIVPLAPGADANALEGLLSAGDPAAPPDARRGMHFDRVWNVLLAADSRSTLERARAIKPADRPDLMKALDAGGDAPVAAAVAPSADSRRAIEELLPTLPKEVGGAPSTVVTRGALWANLALKPPPEASLNLVIQSHDAEAAKALGALIEATVGLLARMVAAEEKVEGIDKLLAALEPRVEADRLVLTLDDPALRRLAGGLIAGPVRQMRAEAKWTRSASNMRQLILACLMWADARRGEWPDDLAKAAREAGVRPQGMNNPLRPGTGYTYRKPPPAVKNTAETIVLYETESSDGQRNVGFMDGRVDRVTEELFQQRLKAMKEQAEKK